MLIVYYIVQENYLHVQKIEQLAQKLIKYCDIYPDQANFILEQLEKLVPVQTT